MCAAFRGFRAEKAGRFCLSEGKPVSDSCDFSFVRLMLIWKIIMAGKTLRHLGLKPSHPGELLREIVIPATRKTKVEIARLLGISRQSLHDILSEKQGVTPAIAMRLRKMFGDGPEVSLRMQNACDIWELNRNLKKDLDKIRGLTAG